MFGDTTLTKPQGTAPVNPDLIIYPKLILTVVCCGFYVPIAIWRLARLMVTGRLDMSPIFPNYTADIRTNPITLILRTLLVLAILVLAILGLVASLDIAFDR
ncbi:UNVERIFIED_ORG: hypothetical protein J2W85_006623 [Ensifer adhaerens]|nr:hypothetical protein [Ensifer adhaerens]